MFAKKGIPYRKRSRDMKKITAIAVALAMVLTMIPTIAMADTEEPFYNSKYKEYYSTLEEAFEDCSEVKITKDMTLDELYIPMGGTLIVPSGKTLKIAEDAPFDTDYRSQIKVEKGGTLYINVYSAASRGLKATVYCHHDSNVYRTTDGTVLYKEGTSKGEYARFGWGEGGEYFSMTKDFRVSVSVSDKKYTVTGKTIKPKLTFTGSGCPEGGLVEGEDYIAKYWYTTRAGRGQVAVIGIGDYVGYYRLKEFKIYPAKASISKVTSKKTSITVTAKNMSDLGTSSYCFKYRKAGSSKWVTVNNRKATKWTFKNLKRDTKYYVRVQCAKFESGYSPLYGTWSSFKSIKTK